MSSWKQLIPTVLLCLLIGLFSGWLVRSAILVTTDAPASPASPAVEVAEETPLAHTVKAGESLSAIGKQFGISWELIAAYNNIPSPYQVTAGTVVNIPSKSAQGAAAEKVRSESEVTLPIDRARLEAAQKEVVLGRLLWRLDPIEVIKRDAPTRYRLVETTIYFLKSKDIVSGTATVEAERSGSKFIVQLVQPIDKGTLGVWAIEKIKGKP